MQPRPKHPAARFHSLQTAPLVGKTLGCAALLLITGCHHEKKMAAGSMAAPGKPASVDNSWLNAARSCWPDLGKNGYDDQQLGRNLIHHLGSAFPSYSALNQQGTDADLSMPITTVLPPNAAVLEHSQTPVLTRGQAVAGTPPAGALVQHTDGDAPADALCSVQTGVPQGFSK